MIDLLQPFVLALNGFRLPWKQLLSIVWLIRADTLDLIGNNHSLLIIDLYSFVVLTCELGSLSESGNCFKVERCRERKNMFPNVLLALKNPNSFLEVPDDPWLPLKEL